MDIKFPARDKAIIEVKKVNENLDEILNSLSQIKDFEEKRNGIETVLEIRKTEKLIEESIVEFQKYVEKNYSQ